jgi:hypothetical protein
LARRSRACPTCPCCARIRFGSRSANGLPLAQSLAPYFSAQQPNCGPELRVHLFNKPNRTSARQAMQSPEIAAEISRTPWKPMRTIP